MILRVRIMHHELSIHTQIISFSMKDDLIQNTDKN